MQVCWLILTVDSCAALYIALLINLSSLSQRQLQTGHTACCVARWRSSRLRVPTVLHDILPATLRVDFENEEREDAMLAYKDNEDEETLECVAHVWDIPGILQWNPVIFILKLDTWSCLDHKIVWQMRSSSSNTWDQKNVYQIFRIDFRHNIVCQYVLNFE